jgi:hypothetical protein
MNMRSWLNQDTVTGMMIATRIWVSPYNCTNIEEKYPEAQLIVIVIWLIQSDL